MERKISFGVGEYYHLYNRGVEKRKIFTCTADYQRFSRLLFLSNSEDSYSYRALQNKPLADIQRSDQLISIGAYCLMPNHFHILVKERGEGSISRFMEKLTTGYSMYFNKKYDRVGPLFQGRFKAEHVSEDSYLQYLYFYISLNPIKLIQPKWKEVGISDVKKAERYLLNYKYSSYMDHVGVEREEKVILDPEAFPDYFQNNSDFKNMTNEWLTFTREPTEGRPR